MDGPLSKFVNTPLAITAVRYDTIESLTWTNKACTNNKKV